MNLRLPWLTRRLVLMAAVVVVAMLAGGLTAVQIRAGQAQEVRDEAAALAEADEAAARAAEQAAERQAATEELAQQWALAAAEATSQVGASDTVLTGSEGKVADDGIRLALAQAMDAVRALVDPEAHPEPGADGEDSSPAGEDGSDSSDEDDDGPAAGDEGQIDTTADRLEGLSSSALPTLAEAVADLVAATTAVTEAQAAWQAEQDALAADAQAQAEAERRAREEAAAQEPALGGPPSTGAGPDCGGPGSYEPPKNEGPTFYTSTPGPGGDGGNGNIPAAQMSALGWCVDSQGNSQWLRSDAAAALTALNAAFRAEFSENIAVDMSYRSLQTQVEMREAYGSMAARPGTSNHGTGLAFDTWEWQAYSFGSPRYEWLVTHGPEHGWIAPDWARQGGSNPEYWHFEYVG